MLRPISFLNLSYLDTPKLHSFSTSLRHSRSLSFMTHSSKAVVAASTFTLPRVQAKDKKRQYHNNTHHKKSNSSVNTLFMLLLLSGYNQVKKLNTQEENDTNKVNDQLRIRSLTQGLSPASLKRIAPFLKDIDSAYMIHYMDNIEALLELAPPTQEESMTLYEKALCSIDINTFNDNFRSWVQDLFLKLSKSALGKMVLEEWIARCDKFSLRPIITELPGDGLFYFLGNHASAPNQIVLDYKSKLYFSSVVSGIWEMPHHITLAHELLHCIRWDTSRISPRPIGEQLTNAEEEYTILGIEKRLYNEFRQKHISHRLLDHLCEAVFLLNEGLPPRLQHRSDHLELYSCAKKSPTNVNPEDAFSDLIELKGKYYNFIAQYTKYEIDIIHENGGKKDIVLEAVKRNGLLYPFASYRLQNDHEVMLKALKNEPSIYSSVAPQLTGEEGLKILIEAIQRTPGLITFIDVEDPMYEQCAFAALRAGLPFNEFPQKWREKNRLFKLESLKRGF